MIGCAKNFWRSLFSFTARLTLRITPQTILPGEPSDISIIKKH